MDISVNIDALQAYLSEDRTVQLIAGLVHDALNQSDLFSVHFEIASVDFGTRAPSLRLVSMRDVDANAHWRLQTHDIDVPGLQKLPFDAPFQAVLGIDCDSDCRILFSATLSYDQIAPGAVRYRISASIASVLLRGRLSVHFLGEAFVLFFESAPEFNFELRLELGSEEKVIDEHRVRDFLCELATKWLSQNMLNGNAVRIPFGAAK
jgi:hypothetical protein